jgi:hypothetical protein
MAFKAALPLSLLVAVCFAGAHPLAWKNPAKSADVDHPIFGAHDYIAFRAYVIAGRPSWLNASLNRYFIGTEAPDNGLKPAEAAGSFNDSGA